MRPKIKITFLLFLMGLLTMILPPASVDAQGGNVWTAYYYNNPNWSGNPVQVNTTQYISYNWGLGSPGPNVPADNFSATYEATIFFYSGGYNFSATADDEVAIVIDGITYLDTRGQSIAGKNVTAYVQLSQGNHQVIVYYREYTGNAYVNVTWSYVKPDGGTPPTPVPQPVPPTPVPVNCGPASQSSVQTQYGNYTPCIQSGKHQSACFQSNGAWNSPNLGSIQTEPQIQIWMNCTADTVTSFTVSCDSAVPQKQFKCSKTEAGYFPN